MSIGFARRATNPDVPGTAAAAFRAAMASDRGRIRQENEDACLILPDRRLCIVADGMGGHQGGAVASRLVVSLLPELLDRHLGPAGVRARSDEEIREALQRSVAALNVEVRLRGAQNPSLRGLGATIVLALLARRMVHVAHLGDSRAYLMRQGRLRQLTADHTTNAAALPSRGFGATGRDMPGRHLLARYVGMDGPPLADVQTVLLEAGDRLLLCTDGLTGMLPDRLLAHLLRHEPDPEATCRALVGAANAAGGRDNVTTLVIHVDTVPALPVGLPAAPNSRTN